MLAEIPEQHGTATAGLACHIFHHGAYPLFELLFALAVYLGVKAQHPGINPLSGPGNHGCTSFGDVSYHALTLQVHKCGVEFVTVYSGT